MEYDYVLYHSTFMRNLPSIRKYGLVIGKPRVWKKYSKSGYLYFSPDPNVAFLWAITSIFDTLIKPAGIKMGYITEGRDSYGKYYIKRNLLALIEITPQFVTDDVVIIEAEVNPETITRDEKAWEVDRSLKSFENVPPEKVSVYEVVDRKEVLEYVIKGIGRGLPYVSRSRRRPKRKARK